MAGANLLFDIEIDDAELRAALQALQDKIGDLTPFFRDAGEALLNSTRERFRSQTAPHGSPWADLSPAYAARKKRNKDKVLTLWGRLRGTLAYSAGPDALRVGTPLIYGATHQFGAAKGSFGAVTAQIKAHVRKGKGGRDAKGRFIAGKVVQVRAHSRKMVVPWGDIPPRPFLGLSDADHAMLLETLEDWLASGGR